MVYEKQIIDILNFGEQTHGLKEELLLNSCIINKLIISGYSFLGQVKITNSVINEFDALGRYFEGGLILSNCIINNKITFEAGGHNKVDAKIEIVNNIFNCFVDFFDAHYEGPFVFRNNILWLGSNLSGNKELSIAVRFMSGAEIENNIGNLCINEEDRTD